VLEEFRLDASIQSYLDLYKRLANAGSRVSEELAEARA
jgi:hypothetical protein